MACKNLLENKLYWIMFVSLTALLIGLTSIYIQAWNLDHNIGWGGDITTIIWHSLLVGSIGLQAIGYSVNYSTNRKTLISLSLLHLVAVILFVISFLLESDLALLFTFLSWILFFANMIRSRKRSLKT